MPRFHQENESVGIMDGEQLLGRCVLAQAGVLDGKARA
jgi:hypothetical protein